MHFDAFDRYHEKESFVHHLDPRVKVVVTIVFIVSNALLPDGAWTAFIFAWLFLLAANVRSRLGMAYTFKRSLIALPFALIAITVLFSMPGKALFTFQLFTWDFTITDAGLLRFVSILIRSWLSVQIALLLVAVTRFPDLIHALEHLRVPAILTTIIAFLYRYLFVLRMRSCACCGLGNLVRRPRQVNGQAGAFCGGQKLQVIWQVNFFCGVTSAVTASTMRCYRADIQVIFIR
jgi:cobalt/nickel transport system permease protein